MYTYKNIDNINTIGIQGLTSRERIKLKVSGVDKPFNKSIKVILKNDRLCLHSQIEAKLKEIKVKPRNIEKANNNFDRVVGVDKNYENVIASSNGITYGDGINKLFNAYTDLTVKQEKNRNRLRQLVRNLKEKGNNEEKIKRITKHNLGNKKINNQKDRLKEEFKSLINKSLDDFFEIERPTELIVEKLNFTVKNNKKGGYNRKAKHKLNSWCKGYVRERIEYKCFLHSIKLTEINAAGTSQMCSVCGFYEGKRSKDGTFHCSHCGGGLPVHLNSALVIKQRLNDVEIKVTTPVWRVTQILKGRNQRLLETKTGATQTQELLIINNSKGQSESELS